MNLWAFEQLSLQALKARASLKWRFASEAAMEHGLFESLPEMPVAGNECINARFRQWGVYQFTVRGSRKVLTVLRWPAHANNLLTANRLLKAAAKSWQAREVKRVTR
jgi:hypothetical protein